MIASPLDLIRTAPLTLQDRCDGPGLAAQYAGRTGHCGAQGFVRVYLDRGELVFCGHHYNQYEVTFLEAGYRVRDERDRINKKPTETK